MLLAVYQELDGLVGASVALAAPLSQSFLPLAKQECVAVAKQMDSHSYPLQPHSALALTKNYD